MSHHPQAWAARLIRRQRGVAAAVEVPQSASEILRRLSELPISTWTYGYDHVSVRHLGPMAQDFAAAFGLGDSDRRIDMLDANGVLMVAVQELTRRVAELERRLENLGVTGETPRSADSPVAERV
ncbi:tail fiber domain-containing protein [Mycobacterium sp. Y57]|nr:tail fiber domain-containing protein [Mycolicibacterium xanthum]